MIGDDKVDCNFCEGGKRVINLKRTSTSGRESGSIWSEHNIGCIRSTSELNC